eukprot:g609.t1
MTISKKILLGDFRNDLKGLRAVARRLVSPDDGLSSIDSFPASTREVSLSEVSGSLDVSNFSWLVCSQLPKEIFVSEGSDFDPICHITKAGKAMSRVCGYSFKPGDLAFNCRDCQFDSTCVICEKCYRASNHEGHDVRFVVLGDDEMQNGCCDCGDVEAWAVEGCCPRHRPVGRGESDRQAELCKLRKAGHIVMEEACRVIWTAARKSFHSLCDAPGSGGRISAKLEDGESKAIEAKKSSCVEDKWTHAIWAKGSKSLGIRTPSAACDASSAMSSVHINENISNNVPEKTLLLLRNMLEKLSIEVPRFDCFIIAKQRYSTNVLKLALLQNFESTFLNRCFRDSAEREGVLAVISSFLEALSEYAANQKLYWNNQQLTMIDVAVPGKKDGVWLCLHLNDNYEFKDAHAALLRRMSQRNRLEHYLKLRQKNRSSSGTDREEENVLSSPLSSPTFSSSTPTRRASTKGDSAREINDWPIDLRKFVSSTAYGADGTNLKTALSLWDRVAISYCSEPAEAYALREALAGRNMRHKGDPNLVMTLVSARDMATENAAVDLLEWLYTVSDVHGGLCDELVIILTRSDWDSTCSSNDDKKTTTKKLLECQFADVPAPTKISSLLQYFVLWYPYVRRNFRRALHRLFLRLLSHRDFKIAFAVSYAYCFEETQRFMNFGSSRRNESLSRLSVQFLNRPTFVNLLTQNGHNLFQQLLSSLHHAVRIALEPFNQRTTHRIAAVNGVSFVQNRGDNELILNLHHPALVQRRYYNTDLDFKYCLQITEAASRFCKNIDQLNSWLELLLLSQDMNLQQRQEYITEGQEQEDYVHAFNLEIGLSSTTALVFKWISTTSPLDESKIKSVIDVTLGFLAQWFRMYINKQRAARSSRVHNMLGAKVSSLSVAELKSQIASKGGSYRDCITKSDLRIRAAECFGMEIEVKEEISFNLHVASAKVSYHCPLHRAFAQLLRAVASVDDEKGTLILDAKRQTLEGRHVGLGSSEMAEEDEVKRGKERCLLAYGLLEWPLRSLVLCAQSRSGMWKRSSMV